MIGKKLLQYEITERLGAGGMGEVFRAHDTNLGRDVAIKVLPESFAGDPERLARFRREAQLLASLNHPNIAAIYGLEEVDGRRFLAMELVEGETLAERLSRGSIPIDEAVPIARQIAEAFEEAHEKGIVHRDLKPGNVQVAPDGRVKVLDFGLGKLVDPFSSDESGRELTQSPTITGMTAPHVILGTAAYMSPEQAKGKAVSWRADIWSYGVILFEMITGRRLFDGETVSETLAAVMKDGVPWSAVPSDTPALYQDLMRRCLERDPRQRLQSIGDARIALERLQSGADSGSVIGVSAVASVTPDAPAHAAMGRGSSVRRVFPWAVAAIAMISAALVWTTRSPQPTSDLPLRKFTLAVDEPLAVRRSVVISPDGQSVAYVAGGKLWVRDLDNLEPRELATDLEADEQLEVVPIWSPDSDLIAYPAGSMLRKIPADGGTGAVICGVTGGFVGGAWLDDGTIVYASPRGPMYSVPASGGDPRVLIPLRPDADVDFHEPTALPGGGVIYSVHHSRAVDTVEMFRDGERRVLFQIQQQHSRNPQVVNYPVYSPSGHIVYRRDQGTRGLWAVPFDVAAGEVTGDPILLVSDGTRASIARDGTLLYIRGAAVSLDQMAWVGLDGEMLEKIGDPMRGLNAPDVSPDGERIAFVADNSGAGELWVHDIKRGSRLRLTFTNEDESQPRWVPGEDRLLYSRWTPDGPSVWSIPASGAGQAELIAPDVLDFDISPDGETLVLLKEDSRKAVMYLRPLAGGDEEVIEEADNVILRYPRFSPDGNYITYMSWENRSPDSFIRELRGPGRWVLPESNESRVRWHPSGHTLFYSRYAERVAIRSVTVETSPVFKLGPPVDLFDTVEFIEFDVGPNGDRLLLVRPAQEQGPGQAVVVVQNWWAEFAD